MVTFSVSTTKKQPKRKTPPKRRSVMNIGYSKYRRRIKGVHLSKDAQTWIKRVGTAAVVIFGVIGIIGAIVLMIFLRNVKKDLPNPGEIWNRNIAEATRIYDRNMNLLYTTFGDQNREYVSLDQIPNVTRAAVLSAEDKDFYEHSGVDWTGLVAAFYDNFRSGKIVRGSSTISQQLVRNTILLDYLGEKAYEQSYLRKIKEILITLELENQLTKDEILELYMNEIPLGGTVYGFQAAAQSYFGKDVSQLTLAESALLAGIIKAPSYYSPLFGFAPEEAIAQKDMVLDLMEKNLTKLNERYGITQEDIDEARLQQITYNPKPIDIKSPHFVLWVRQLLVEMYGAEVVEQGGLTVITSLDYDMQQIAQEEIRVAIDGTGTEVGFREQYNVNNGAMVVLDPQTGEILVMVGSYDYWTIDDPRVDGNVNVTLSPRQMGSAVKPITYLTAFEQGYSPSTLAPDISWSFGAAYQPKNWDGRYDGIIPMRDALLRSRNLPALYTSELVGVHNFVATAERLGISTLNDVSNYGVSITLGTAEMKLLELTNAYAAFASGGIQHEPVPILKVLDKKDNVIYEADLGDSYRVINEQEAYLLNWVLCNESNTTRPMKELYTIGGQRLCGKTGTTDGPRDLTSFLYYPKLVVGVWAGNNNNEVTCGYRYADGTCRGQQGWSTTVPLPIAHSYLQRVIGRFDKAWITRPGNIVEKRVCMDTGLPAGENTACPTETFVFNADSLPDNDDSHKTYPICRVNGLIATNESEARQMGLIDDIMYVDYKLVNTNHDNEWHKWLTDHRDTIAGMLGKNIADVRYAFELPAEATCPLGLGGNNEPVVAFSSPVEGQEVIAETNLRIAFTTISLDPIVSAQIFFDSTLVGTGDINSNSADITYLVPSGTTTGNHIVRVVVRDSADRVTEATRTVSVRQPRNIFLSVSVVNGFSSSVKELQANLSGADIGDVNSVTFYVYNSSNTLVKTLSGEISSVSLWTTNMTISDMTSGAWYTIYAVAKAGVETFESAAYNYQIP
ncbi:transglycosylase domain-containing protein [Candidatus Dojkabacteria bacterium]|nr:transglycosylase domain-containing protein [Candidatus Dojkabacteria bacterium]